MCDGVVAGRFHVTDDSVTACCPLGLVSNLRPAVIHTGSCNTHTHTEWGRGGGGRGGGGGGDDLDGYVKVFDSPPGVYSDRSDDWNGGGSSSSDGGGKEVFMDQKGSGIGSPKLRSHNAGRPNHADETPRDLSVNQSRDETSRRDDGRGDGIFAMETTTTETRAPTTTAPDPIHEMYNGSVPKGQCNGLISGCSRCTFA